MLYVYVYEEKEGDESQIRFKLEFEILEYPCLLHYL